MPESSPPPAPARASSPTTSRTTFRLARPRCAITEPYRAFVAVARAVSDRAPPIIAVRRDRRRRGCDRACAAARLERDVTVDPGVVIGPGAEIGAGTVIAANAVIGPGVRIGRTLLDRRRRDARAPR
jgi:UDP-3-O-[3-hydroxymyristoyl] glucosamine N-acyltransferase